MVSWNYAFHQCLQAIIGFLLPSHAVPPQIRPSELVGTEKHYSHTRLLYHTWHAYTWTAHTFGSKYFIITVIFVSGNYSNSSCILSIFELSLKNGIHVVLIYSKFQLPHWPAPPRKLHLT